MNFIEALNKLDGGDYVRMVLWQPGEYWRKGDGGFIVTKRGARAPLLCGFAKEEWEIGNGEWRRKLSKQEAIDKIIKIFDSMYP